MGRWFIEIQIFPNSVEFLEKKIVAFAYLPTLVEKNHISYVNNFNKF